MTAPKLSVRSARKTFTQVKGAAVCALADLSFDVAEGEYVAIVGPTGAGKSVLLDCLLDLKQLDAGEIRIDGQPIGAFLKGGKGRITRIFQEDRLLPWLTARDNAALGLQIRGTPKAERRARAQGWLEAMGLGKFGDALPAELSGGMRQRVNIARAFAPQPEIVLLDEPFSALDEITATRLRRDFKAAAEAQRTTFLIVTHNIEEAIFLARRILVFGAPARVLADIAVPEGAAENPAAVERIRNQIHRLMTPVAGERGAA
jgi:ABC-type nitrate/sulfonate/bicarbonate transport system ATPase subunit